MYTGTLIHDLLATVERTEERLQRQREKEEAELRHLFALQAPPTQFERVFAGAA